MKKTMKLIIGLIIPFTMIVGAYAQTGKEDGSKFGKGEDSARCVRNLSLYREYARNKDFGMAYSYWVIPFDECPQSSKNLYIDGAKIYRDKLDEVKDDARRAQLSDTLMLIYDRRIEFFGEKGKVRGYQGADLLKYRRNDGAEYILQGYQYLKESLELKEEDASKAVLPTLLSASLTLYKLGEIDDKQVIDDYLTVSEIMDIMIAERPSDGRLADLKLSLDNNFAQEGPGDCDKLIEIFKPQFETQKSDPAFLEMLTSLLKNRDCTDSELYYAALKELHKTAPSAESAVKIALWARDNNLYKETVEYFGQAIDLESDAVKKADYYFGQAVAYQKLGDKTSSRKACYAAAESKSGYGEPYILIGQLYADSKDECTDASDKANLPNAVFWVAVDKFLKAKAVDPDLADRVDKLIQTYTPYYPNKEEAFFKGVNEGQTYKVGCWINESTTVRF
ncbi:MAG: hypothetical protein JXA77_18795 [Bacteroidales bacterium]|nr:hypothetical protein [Bacteroidales bacterium]MBN2821482.1 hypothetical protein [Bacteroidales bacterium]